MNRRATPKPKRKRPPRKSTFVARKEEKQRLERELARLQAQWLALQAEDELGRGSPTSPSSLSVVASPPPPPPPPPSVTLSQDSEREEEPAALAVVRDRHLAFTGLRSLLSAYLSTPEANATNEPIRLPLDTAARRATLLRASVPAIQQARRSVLERCRFLDLSRPHLATEWFEREDKSMSLMQFDVTPFRDVRCSVQDVYDAIGFYAQNVEILVSERIGDLTLREDDEVEPVGAVAGCGARVSQRRLMSATNYGITIDANVAVFRQHFDAGACSEMPQEHAILSTQSVHSDELYPYQADRVRYDHESVTLVQQVPTADGELVTTLVRMVTFTRHSSNGAHPITNENEAPLRTLSMQWWDLMLLSVHEHVLASARAASSTSPMPSELGSP